MTMWLPRNKSSPQNTAQETERQTDGQRLMHVNKEQELGMVEEHAHGNVCMAVAGPDRPQNNRFEKASERSVLVPTHCLF